MSFFLSSPWVEEKEIISHLFLVDLPCLMRLCSLMCNVHDVINCCCSAMMMDVTSEKNLNLNQQGFPEESDWRFYDKRHCLDMI